MWIPVCFRICRPIRWRIFFLSVCFRDCRCFDDAVTLTYPRVDALGIKSCANCKKPGHNCNDKFLGLLFSYFILGKDFAAGNSDGCSTRQIQKRFEPVRRDPACLFQVAQSVFFFENSELVQFNSSQQGAINRPHELRRCHSTAVFVRKRSRRAIEKFTRSGPLRTASTR